MGASAGVRQPRPKQGREDSRALTAGSLGSSLPVMGSGIGVWNCWSLKKVDMDGLGRATNRARAATTRASGCASARGRPRREGAREYLQKGRVRSTREARSDSWMCCEASEGASGSVDEVEVDAGERSALLALRASVG